jgi:hypothetical protein
MLHFKKLKYITQQSSSTHQKRPKILLLVRPTNVPIIYQWNCKRYLESLYKEIE